MRPIHLTLLVWLLLCGSACAQLKDGVTEYFTLNNTLVGAHAGVTLANTGASATTGQVYAQAYDLEVTGGNDHLTVADSATLSTGDINYFWIIWVNTESNPGGGQFLLSKDSAAGGGREYHLYITSGGAPQFGVSGDGTNVVSVTGDTISTGSWHMILCGHDATNNELYISVDAGAYDTQAHSAGSFDTTTQVQVGSRNSTLSLDGVIGPVALFKGRTKPADAVVDAYYNSGSGVTYAALTYTANRPRMVLNARTVPLYVAADSNPPSLVDIMVPNGGDAIGIDYNEAVVGTEELGWTFTASGGALTASSGTGSGTTHHTLTPSRTIDQGETITATYSSSTGDLVDGAANDLSNITDYAVTNASTQGDPGIPEVLSIVTQANGTDTIITYDENVSGTEELGWTLTAGGSPVSPSGGSGSGTATHTLTHSTINNGVAITADYVSATGDLTDGSNDVQDVMSFPVTNNSTQGGGATGDPILPQNTVDVSLPTGWDKVTPDATVAAGGNLQTALNNAVQNGGATYVIEVEAGATFTGNFSLPIKTGNDWIVVRSSNFENLPVGTRVDGPVDSADMAKLTASNTTPTLDVPIGAPGIGAHNYRFIGLEIENTNAATINTINYIICDIQGGQGCFNDNIIFDRCYVHGAQFGQSRCGIAFGYTYKYAVKDCDIREIHTFAQSDSFAIYINNCAAHNGINAAGLIHNNNLEAAGENFFTGDNDTSIGVQDVTFTGNRVFKPLAWQSNIPSGPCAGQKWKVKNLLEIKDGLRILIEGNRFENCWVQSQTGFSVLFSPRADFGVQEVTFRRNLSLNTAQGIQFSASTNNQTDSYSLHNLLIEDNAFQTYSTRILQTGRANPEAFPTNMILRNNTFVCVGGTGSLVLFEGTQPGMDGWTVKDNIFNDGYGILGTGTSRGLPTVSAYTTNYDWDNNVIIRANNGAGTHYTEGAGFANFLYSASNSTVGFTDTAFDDLTDFALAGGSAYNNAGTDGEDIGADISLIQGAMSDSDE